MGDWASWEMHATYGIRLSPSTRQVTGGEPFTKEEASRILRTPMAITDDNTGLHYWYGWHDATDNEDESMTGYWLLSAPEDDGDTTRRVLQA